MQSIDLTKFKEERSLGHLVVDTRQPELFCEGFIPQSVSVSAGEAFIATLQEIVEDGQPLLLVADQQELPALIKALKYSGWAQVRGILPDGFAMWQTAEPKFDMLITIEPDEFAIDYQYDEFFLIDVRPAEAFDAGHIEDAENIPLAEVENLLVDLDTEGSYYLYADTLAHAVTAASLFRHHGFHKVRVVAADYEALRQTKLPFYKPKKKGDNSELSKN